jgi:hypothetical protein
MGKFRKGAVRARFWSRFAAPARFRFGTVRTVLGAVRTVLERFERFGTVRERF